MRTGRPKKDPDDLKTEEIAIPLTTAEKDLILAAAKADESRHVPWSRKLLVAAATKRLAKGKK